ncbi:MAG: hypothetical protein DMG73_00770 [Acidobacteria bacterium]|nr:MAG: hypothetical protein DMG73_00770 [Acidobacteriota bacterium]
MDAVFIFVVEVNGAASLPLGIESTFAINNDVIRLALLSPIIHMVADDERAILAVAAEVEFRVKPQVVGGADRRRNYQKQYYRRENLLHSVLYEPDRLPFLPATGFSKSVLLICDVPQRQRFQAKK